MWCRWWEELTFSQHSRENIQLTLQAIFTVNSWRLESQRRVGGGREKGGRGTIGFLPFYTSWQLSGHCDCTVNRCFNREDKKNIEESASLCFCSFDERSRDSLWKVCTQSDYKIKWALDHKEHVVVRDTGNVFFETTNNSDNPLRMLQGPITSSLMAWNNKCRGNGFTNKAHGSYCGSEQWATMCRSELVNVWCTHVHTCINIDTLDWNVVIDGGLKLWQRKWGFKARRFGGLNARRAVKGVSLRDFGRRGTCRLVLDLVFGRLQCFYF